MIVLKDVNFSYGEKNILDNFNLTVNNGECVCLVGKSGCGKTTVMRLICGLETPDSGQITAPDRISCVFQDDRLIPHLNTLHNITLFLEDEQSDTAIKLLKESGLENAAEKKPVELSGGMKRRASIVRAIAFNGSALLLDEPFNGLDYERKSTMAEIIKREFCRKNKPVLMISHIPEDAQLMDARIVNI